MKFLARGMRIALVSFFSLPLAAHAAEHKSTPADSTPAALVKAALEAELTGPADARDKLLNQALELDPNYAPARWQLGYVKIGSQWVKVGDAPPVSTNTVQLVEYRKLRDSLVDTAENHAKIAEWCRKNKLVEEERIHWAKVLEFEPNNADAMQRLALERKNGELIARKQAETVKAEAGQRRRAMQQWQPKLVKWRQAIETGNPKKVEEVQTSLRQLNDPAALPALEIVFGVNGDSPKSLVLNKLLAETAGRISHPDATELLLRRSLVPESTTARAAAADELKKRPIHTYVPRLIAALPGAVKTQYHIHLLPGGMVVHEHELLFEGRQANQAVKIESVDCPTDGFTALAFTPRALMADMANAQAIEQQAAVVNQNADWVRNRIRFVLERTTGFEDSDNAAEWQRQFDDFTGFDTRPVFKPTFTQTYSRIVAYVSPPTTTKLTTTPKEQAPVDMPTLPSRYNSPFSDVNQANMVRDGVISFHNCFAAGTPVMTLDGPRAIETIKSGDRVLSQDLGSGELTYKVVQERTLRSARHMVRIDVDGESITATSGHPFWAAGRGWTTAKLLNEGDVLHGVLGPVPVKAVEKLKETEVYNLVVSDFHNYFVGKSRLLVHDNSPILDNAQSLPGLTASAR